jgi:hypothetical protein
MTEQPETPTAKLVLVQDLNNTGGFWFQFRLASQDDVSNPEGFVLPFVDILTLAIGRQLATMPDTFTATMREVMAAIDAFNEAVANGEPLGEAVDALHTKLGFKVYGVEEA